jgi:CRP-like cAMP-binding protein
MTISEHPPRSHTPGPPFLTDEDWATLLGQARLVRFTRDEVIVVEGAPGIGIGLIREGYVRVERASVGRGIAVARRGPGEVISEISYLQRTGASASVVADGESTSRRQRRRITLAGLRSDEKTAAQSIGCHGWADSARAGTAYSCRS